jgi:lysylphosphatidylglycerol synthetase-like protein (DUF2156 family)
VIRNRDGRIDAFATVWESAGREELSVDLMRPPAGGVRRADGYLFLG